MDNLYKLIKPVEIQRRNQNEIIAEINKQLHFKSTLRIEKAKYCSETLLKSLFSFSSSLWDATIFDHHNYWEINITANGEFE